MIAAGRFIMGTLFYLNLIGAAVATAIGERANGADLYFVMGALGAIGFYALLVHADA